MTTTTDNEQLSSLLAINAHKAQLQKELDKCEEDIRKQWNDLFHTPRIDTSSPTQRMFQFITSSAGLIDGAIFGWKLYRRFRK